MMVPSLREISAYATTLSDSLPGPFPLGPLAGPARRADSVATERATAVLSSDWPASLRTARAFCAVVYRTAAEATRSRKKSSIRNACVRGRCIFSFGPPGRIAFGPIYAHRSHYKPVHMVSTHCRGSPLMMLPRTTPEVQVVVSNPCWESREASVSPWARSRVSRRRTTVVLDADHVRPLPGDRGEQGC